MASSYSPVRGFMHRWMPWVLRRLLLPACPGGNLHWRWERYCWSCDDELEMVWRWIADKPFGRWVVAAKRSRLAGVSATDPMFYKKHHFMNGD